MDNVSTTSSALSVRGAYKRYNASSVVLNGLNMDVPQGAIYGLLGPSGCGKTTLLSCIVGRVRLDAGEIISTARRMTDIGFMPQEMALYGTMNIQETFLYFGTMNGMTKQEVYSRTEELIRLLELRSADISTDKLSGGQQRRVSFAVAILHDPQLLILDEPTVGLDPVLRQSIWEYLLKLATIEKKSIIITTHYIEEARQANLVGLMRDGILLAQDSPTQVMISTGCDTLEHAFLELSGRQQGAIGSGEELDKSSKYPEKQKPAPKPPVRNSNIFDISRFVAQLFKNFFFLWRDKPMVMFLFGLPILQCTLYNIAIGRDPVGLSIAVVNHELQNGLSDCANIPDQGCHLDLPLSCRYVELLRTKRLTVVEYLELEDAEATVRRNDAWGLVYFGQNYSEALIRRLEDFQARDEVVEDAMVNVKLDMSNQYIGNMLKRDLFDSYLTFLKHLFKDCQWNSQFIEFPVRLKDPVFGDRDPSFIHYVTPAVIVVFVFYMPLMFTVSVIMEEKLTGTLERSIVAGLTTVEIILAHSILQMAILCIQTATMLVVMYVIFDSPFIGNFYWTVGLLLLDGVWGMTFGFLVSVLADSMFVANILVMGSFGSLSLISGMMWPREGMHPVLRVVGWLLPISMSSESIRSLTARGWGITHHTVYLGYISTLIWIGLFIAGTFLTIHLRNGLRSSK